MDFIKPEEVSTYGIVEIYRNLLKMLKDRGYDVEVEQDIYKDMTEDEFWYQGGKEKRNWSELNQVYEHPDKPKKLQTIWIPSNPTSDKIKIDYLVKEMKKVSPDGKDKDFLFLSDKPVGNPAGEKLELLSGIEFWMYERLRINIPNHYLIDRVEKISTKEAGEIMRNMQIKPCNFPVISIQDMLVRWYGWEIGDLIRIWVNREHIGKEVHYRMVTAKDFSNAPIKDTIFN